jgi:hypothetical protein
VGAVGTPARLVLYVGFAVVIGLAVLGRRDGGGVVRPVPALVRGDGVLEGRVELAEDFIALRRCGNVPALLARVELPFGLATAEVEDNGRFCLVGLPLCVLDLELRLGGELLARVTGITPCAANAQYGSDVALDPRLFGITLAGPLRLIEVEVVGVDGVGLDHGWLAWRASGAVEYERVVPVRAGRASIVTCSEIVDVVALIAGFDTAELVCAVGGERLDPSPVAAIVALGPDVPDGVMLRLEVVEGRLVSGLGLAGDALLRSGEVRGGWADAEGRAELQVVGQAQVAVQWGAYRRYEDRLTRARGVRGEVVVVPAGGFGERRVVAPLHVSEEMRRRERGWSR